MIQCPNCGTMVPDGNLFCNNCGTKVADAQPQYPNYHQPEPQQFNYQQPMGLYRVPISRKEIWLMVLLSLVTCGVYGYYWFYCIINDLNASSQRSDDQTPGMIILLSIVTCGIYGMIWMYNAGEKVDAIRQYNGEMPSNSGVTYLLLSIFGLFVVDYALIQTELNKIAMYQQ